MSEKLSPQIQDYLAKVSVIKDGENRAQIILPSALNEKNDMSIGLVGEGELTEVDKRMILLQLSRVLAIESSQIDIDEISDLIRLKISSVLIGKDKPR